MNPLTAYQPVSASSICVFEGLLGALPPERHLELFSRTLDIPGLREAGLGYEFRVLERALGDPSPPNLARAFSLYQRPGRLFYHAAREARTLAETLEIAIDAPPEDPPLRPEDAAAQSAWHRFDRFASGAARLMDMGALYDPVGALSGGIIYFLDKQGLKSHWDEARRKGEEWAPPPSFGVLSRENPARLERYNRGLNDQVGDVNFGFPPELQMTVVPQAYADLLRRKSGFHVTIPASEILGDVLTPEWAGSLPPGALVLNGMKGLYDGLTPLEYEEKILGPEGMRQVIDFLGFASSSKETREIREYLEGKRPSLAPLEIVLACLDANRGVELAMRYCGPSAQIGFGTFEGIPIVTVEDLGLPKPVRFVVLSDRDAIRANEKASIDKNLQALRLGGDLFRMMEERAVQGVAGDDDLYRRFASEYRTRMEQAEQDIRKVLELEGIPASKRVLLPGVVKDLYGSWGTEDFKNLYGLVRRIFAPDAAEEEWREATILLKLQIRRYYSVRNPCYGFGMAADRAAMMHGRGLDRETLKATARRMVERGQISEADVALLGDPSSAHFFFSTIPEGLLPEGLQIAAQLPDRCRLLKIEMGDLPESYRDAFFLVQRLQRSALFDADVYRRIVEVSRELAHVFLGDPRSEKTAYLSSLAALRTLFEKGYALLRASGRVIEAGREAQGLVARIVGHVRLLVRNIESNGRIGPAEIAVINQGVIEALTVANLFYILPPEESRTEAERLNRRLKALASYAKTLDLDEVFPPSSAPEGGIDAQAARLMVKMRDRIFAAIGERLIDLTYQMNVRLHSVDRAITRGEVGKALDRMIREIEEAIRGSDDSPADPMAAFLLGGVVQMVRQTRNLLPRKLSARQSLLTYQALVEALIHTRRFLVMPEDRAEVEIRYTLKRFSKIQAYLKGHPEVKSPLWNFGNGNSNPPPPLS
jgi:hypothetical protein